MSNKRFGLFALLLISSILLCLYFVLVNTTFKNTVLPNIRLAGENISFANNAQIEDLIDRKYLATLPQNLKVRFEGEIYSIPVSLLNIKVDYSRIMNYGKGSNISNVIQQGFTLIGGTDLEPELSLNIEPIIKSIPYYKTVFGESTLAMQSNLDELPNTGDEISPADHAYFDGMILRNCSSNNYQFNFDETKIKNNVKNALGSNNVFDFELNQFITDPTQYDLVTYCKTYRESLQKLDNFFPEKADWDNILNYKIDSVNKTKLEIRDKELMFGVLSKIKSTLDVTATEGEYIDKDGKLYMYKTYNPGKSLNLITSFDSFTNWLNDPDNTQTVFSFDEVKPPMLTAGKEMVDVSKQLAAGKSRLDINRDGRHNYRIENAQVALDHLNNTIITPGEEISFFKVSGMQYDGVRAGIGVCNASTTFYRAALEAGFPITERHPHTSQIWSYEYPFYPINIVEATFFAGPVVDTKILNDLQYPVLLHFVIDRDEAENWQYHTIEVYTSPEAPDRKVELRDFAKTSVRDTSHFVGSFWRTVKDNGVITREDKWVSTYYN